MTRNMFVAALLLTAAVPVAASAQQQAASKTSATSFSIDDLYRFKSLIGTTPEKYSWSRDGDAVLFLWNDEGYSFRDIWSYSVKTGKKTRLTFLARDASPEAEQPGITQAVFLDKGRIAFTLRGRLNIREADGKVSAVEADKAAIRQLSVSPDGRRLAFVSASPGDSRGRIVPGGVLWVRDVFAKGDSAARRVAGEDDPKVYVDDYRWGADGNAVAFDLADDRAMPERDIYYYAKGGLQDNRVIRAFPGDETTKARIGVADLVSGKTRFYERPDARHHVWGYDLSHDGKRLFVNSSDMQAKEHTIYVFDVALGQRETFYQLTDPTHIRPDWKVAWAPGDDGLIILTDRDGWLHLYHQKSAGAAPRAITQGEWEIASFDVDAAHGQIYFVANKAALPERQIYRVPVAGGEVQRVSPEVAGTHEPVFSPDFRHVADFFTNDATPPELFAIDTAKPGKAVQVTRSPQPDFYTRRWANVSYVEFPSTVDGAKIIGRLSLPPDFDRTKRYPMIVGSVYSDAVQNQWGGRRAHPTWGIDQYFTAQGYIVFNVNLRGSWGQGRQHNVPQLHHYGETDINDIESGVRYLVSQGYVDPARVGIWGSSYGGLMTVMSLSKKPGVYAAGIAGAPATNVWHAFPAQMWIMGPPDGPDMPGRYEAQSALWQVQGVKDPLMLIHGTRDSVVLYSDTTALTEKMIGNGQMFELVTLPGANHGWDNEGLVQARFAYRKMAEFFDRNVKNRK